MKNKVYNLFEICNPKQWKTISIDNLDKNGKYPVYGANGIIGYYSEYNHEKPTLCITCRGATSGELNISTSYSYINGNTMALDDLDETKVDINFLYYFLKKRGFKDIISGSAQPQITRIALKKINIPLYTLNFQKKVASDLKKAEDIITFYKNQLLNLTELVKSLFTTMFGDIKTNDKNWEIKKLKELVEIKSFIINENLNFIWLLNLEDIEPNTGKLIKKREVSFKNIPSSTISFNENYVLYSKLRPYLNKVFLPDEKGFGTSELVPLLPKKNIHKIFLTEYLRNDKIVDFLSQKVSGAKMPRVIMKDFQDLNLIFPPIELQNKFAERIENIEKLKFEIEKSIETAQNLYDSLISKYFDN
ncbi:restriction endonuclease subunit S [Fusobacterium pseudoperiodonticum]|uniref:restriction endonuclease subunit S n=1 Tax=Fusobacterium pseudoperiodonticum TaxID=2663009 RepID=UPI0030CB96E5